MKVIVLSIIIYFFTLVQYSAASDRDCSNPKKLHEKLICKMGGSSKTYESNLNEKQNKTKEISMKKSVFGKIKEVITQDTLVDAVKKAKE